jgi:predicted HAD superfamily Cof-like phosphohydrolase
MKTATREDKVREFHKAMELAVNSVPYLSLLQLRKKLIQEEFLEVRESIEVLEMEFERGKTGSVEQWAHLLKELGDLQYVISGTLVSLSTLPDNLNPAFNRIHSSNMSKFGEDGKPIRNEDGKVLKGPYYKEPDLRDLINA